MECKAALKEAEGHLENAEVILRKKGIASATKKASRTTKQGVIGTYIHPGAQLGVLIEVNCESDFVARTEDFQELVHDLAMQVAAADPQFLRKEDVTEAALAKEREIHRARALGEGKPEKMLEKIVEGRLNKFYEEVCLYEQPFIKENTTTIADLIKSKIAKMGENITVSRFVRFKVGDAACRASGNPAAETRPTKWHQKRAKRRAAWPPHPFAILATRGKISAHPAEAERRGSRRRRIFRNRRRESRGSGRGGRGSGARRRADRDGGGRREFLPRRGRRGAEYGPRRRRSHGHAGDGNQCAGPARRARKERSAHARDDRHPNAFGGRAVHSPPSHSPSGKRPAGDLRRRNLQSRIFQPIRRRHCARWRSMPSWWPRPRVSTGSTTRIR